VITRYSKARWRWIISRRSEEEALSTQPSALSQMESKL
jgi:hypothetical protein